MKRGEQIHKNVSRPSTPPDELAQNVSKKKNPRRTNYSSIFLKKFRIWPFWNYLHDSNSIFWAQGIKSEWVSGGTVLDGRRRQVNHEVNEQDTGWRFQCQRRVHQVIDPDRVVEPLEVDHGECCVHPAFCWCHRHGVADERATEPRATSFSAPSLYGRQGDHFPDADPSSEVRPKVCRKNQV